MRSEVVTKFPIVALALSVVLWTISAAAQCINTIKPSCDVYETCFAKACNCETSPDEYFVAFGTSYCKAFLGQSGFTTEGSKWRDSTLRCLQEAIVPILPASVGGTCDCNAAKKYALSTHVSCYTKPDASVCDLPASDVAKVAATILVDGPFKQLLKDREDALHQALATIEICATSSSDTASRASWKALRMALAAVSAVVSKETTIIKASFPTFHEASQSTVSEVDRRLLAAGFTGSTTNTKRMLYMDLLRAFGIAQIRFGYSCFDLGCGVLVKAVVGKRKQGSKDTIMDLGILAVGKSASEAFSLSVANNGLEEPLTASQTAYEIDKSRSYYFWTTKRGISVFPY